MHAMRGRRTPHVCPSEDMDTIIYLVGASLLMSLVVMIDIWLDSRDP